MKNKTSYNLSNEFKVSSVLLDDKLDIYIDIESADIKKLEEEIIEKILMSLDLKRQ